MLKPTYWAHDLTFSETVSDSFNNIVNVVEREGRGHPGYMVRWVEENLFYPSQINAAIAHDIAPNRMSDHLNNRLENVDGKHFERVVLAA